MSTKLFRKSLTLALFTALSLHSTSMATAEPRYISLTPATTEILYALGLDKEIVGVTSICNYPDKAKQKEKIGTFSRPDIEKIILLKPDIIFATGLEQAPSVEILRQLHFKIVVSDPNSIESLFESIQEIAHLTDHIDQGNTLIASMKDKIIQLTTSQRNNKIKPSVLITLWHDPIMTVGRKSFLDEMLSIAGAHNATHDIAKSYAYINIEYVLMNDPDIIVLTYMTNEPGQRMLLNKIGWASTNALKNNKVYDDINSDILLRPGPRIVEGIQKLQEKINQ